MRVFRSVCRRYKVLPYQFELKDEWTGRMELMLLDYRLFKKKIAPPTALPTARMTSTTTMIVFIRFRCWSGCKCGKNNLPSVRMNKITSRQLKLRPGYSLLPRGKSLIASGRFFSWLLAGVATSVLEPREWPSAPLDWKDSPNDRLAGRRSIDSY